MNKDKIKKRMEDQVKFIAELVNKMNVSEPIYINNIDKVDEVVFEDDIKVYKNKPVVYIIALKNKRNNSSLPENIKELFDEKRKKYGKDKAGKDKWCVSNINYSNWKTDSNYLYVGSSYGNIITRMKQHLAIGNSTSRKAFSLWLKDWFNESKLPQGIEIFFIDLKGMSPNEIYMIEDLLWRGLSPLFGRSGKSPKSN